MMAGEPLNMLALKVIRHAGLRDQSDPAWYKASDLASRPNRERYHAWPIAWCATDRNGLDQFPFASVRDAQAEAP